MGLLLLNESGQHMHHVQGNTSIQVHPWEKRQFKFIQLNNPVQNGGK